ncbi:hypothetical protein PR001_g14140 [Phytophthora rubi]|uniref:Uncharacterized protein n=1 Tax=Phytophthora rubi TaxID=129364 RepID=A0A6A3LH02_9STRA|nr:hypothetical protein PR002_g14541 [Phytophthora rubi]KAE9018419.1 hypothetical protein PR001_g14140 [Phytophthora rubi]
MGNPGWDEDGGPSSMEVLLDWLRAGDNAQRWMDSAGKIDGSRLELTHEIHDFMRKYGINYRTPSSIRIRVLTLEHQLHHAETWMRSRGLRRHDASEKTEQTVLQMCPYYAEIKSLLRTKKPSSETPRAHQESYYQEEVASTEEEPEVDESGGSSRKRGSIGECPDVSKRMRIEPQLQHVQAEGSSAVVLLEAEPDERREFFELELQVKRDHAICVRAKARNELLELGVPLDDVDRLLPL